MENDNLEIKELFIPKNQNEVVIEKEKDFTDVLKMFAPGTSIRTALDDLLRARMGALIVFDNGYLSPIVEKGFKINCKFTPQKLVELAKMDGAIILSKDGKKILSANTLLNPSVDLSTKETGTRHKAAERTAKQAKTIVIAVSERKNKISLFYGDVNYALENSSEILRRATETLHMLEKQKEVFNELLDNLNLLELRRIVSINDVGLVLQRTEIMKRIEAIVKNYLVELGQEGIIVRMRLRELMGNTKKEQEMILKDYFGKDTSYASEMLEKMSFDFLLEPLNITRMLFEELHDKSVSPRGIRILSKTNILERYVDALVAKFQNLSNILKANDEDLLTVLETDAMVAFFREEIYNLKEKVSIGKRI
ncbi:DNA integrity scanning protein DisA [Candidatus Pacearchaeota archaeon ex4484_71]|nr:MAG: DNA integrity scanning protein DisA [Candidatus Pacearchaeota archaeon ex4484_71]